MQKSLITAALVAAFVSSACLAGAQTDAIDLNYTDNVYTNYNEWTLGWDFTTGNQALNVTALGTFDNGSVATIGSPTVGIWTAGGTLLGTANLSGTLTQSNYFAFTSNLSNAISLAANTEYLIGSTGIAPYEFSFGNNTTTNLGITFNGDRWIGGAGLTFPTLTDETDGFYGANFQATATPEPASFLALGLPALGLLVKRRKK